MADEKSRSEGCTPRVRLVPRPEPVADSMTARLSGLEGSVLSKNFSAESTAIAKLVDEQRGRIFGVMDVLSTVQACIREVMPDVARDEPGIGGAVEVTYDMLNCICERLDPLYVGKAIKETVSTALDVNMDSVTAMPDGGAASIRALEKKVVDGVLDETAMQVLCYLHSVRPMDGNAVNDDAVMGRQLVERMVWEAQVGEIANPSLRECCDILAWTRSTEPLAAPVFMGEPIDPDTAATGCHVILGAVESSLREMSA